MQSFIIFAILLTILDIPFVNKFVLPKYKAIGLGLQPKMIFALCAYTVMFLSWFLIKGDVFKGMLLGFVVYAIYAFTLATILPGYTLSFALTEIVWGTFLFTLVTFLTNIITNKLKG